MAQEVSQTDLVVSEAGDDPIVMQTDLVATDLTSGSGPGPGPGGSGRRPVIIACGE